MTHPTIPDVEIPGELVDAIKLAGSLAWEKFFEYLLTKESLKVANTPDENLVKLKAKMEGIAYVRRLVVDVATHFKPVENQKP